MREYTMETIEIGMEETFEAEITQDMQDQFTGLTGDVNPMHLSEEYAHINGYKGKLVYGMLTASFYSTLIGVYLPGKYCLFHEYNAQFPLPVFIGDKLSITGKVVDINKKFNRVTIKAFIKNQNGEKVSRATLIVGIRKGENDSK